MSIDYRRSRSHGSKRRCIAAQLLVCIAFVMLHAAPAAALTLSPRSAVLLAPDVSSTVSTRFSSSVTFPEQLGDIELCIPNCANAIDIATGSGTVGGSGYGATWQVATVCLFDTSQMNADCNITVSFTPLSAADSSAELRVTADDGNFANDGGSPGDTLAIATEVELTASLTGRVEQSFSVISFDSSSVAGDEGDRLSIPVTRTGSGADLSEAVTLTFSTESADAELNDDFAFPNGATVSWGEGQGGTRNLLVDLLSDDVSPESESFDIIIDSASLGDEIIGQLSSVNVTIGDVVPVEPGIVQLNPTTDEVEEGESVTFNVTRTGGSDGAGSVNWVLGSEGDTATFEEDYATSGGRRGTLTWDDGEARTQTLTFNTATDNLVEGSETFTLTLQNPSGVALGANRQATVTIIDPTEPDVVAFANSTVRVSEASSSVGIIVTRDGTGAGAASVTYTLTAGTASLTTDIQPDEITGEVSWTSGDDDSQAIVIPIVNDDQFEADETFSLALSDPVGVTLGQPTTVTVTLVNDDPPESEPGTVQFTQSAVSVDEDAGAVLLNVSRINGSDGEISVDVSVSSGTATAASDFTAVSRTLTWDSDDTESQSVSIPITFDSIAEDAESFTVMLSDAEPGNEVIGSPAAVTVTINDVFNGQPGTLQFAQGSLTVDEDDGSVNLAVTRAGGSDGEVSVNYTTLNGSARAGQDFVATTGVLTWEDGDADPKTLSVAVINDDDDEQNETFTVVLSDAEPLGDNLQLGSPSRATITVRNVEPPVVTPDLDAGTVQFTATSYAADEADETVTITVERIGGTDGAVSIQYETTSDTAVAGTDFTQASGILEWADGDDEPKSFTVDILVDSELETAEMFEVVLLNPMSPDDAELDVGTDSAVVTITDSTNVGQLRFVAAEVVEAEAEGQVTVEIERVGGSDGPVTVNYSIVEETASAGADYIASSSQVGWGDGEMGTRSVTIILRRDNLNEGNESFLVRLANAMPADAEITVSEMRVVISDSTVPDSDPSSEPPPYELTIVGGDDQGGLPGDVLDPLIIEAQPTAPGNTTIAGVSIRWQVTPAGSAELLDGDLTETDTAGRASNRVRILDRGFVRVLAVADVTVESPTGTVPVSSGSELGNRINPPAIDLSAGTVAFTVRAGFFAAEGLNANQAETGGALDVACETLNAAPNDGQALSAAQQDLRNTCASLDTGLQDGTLQGALDRLAPEELFYFADSVVSTADLQLTNVYSRIIAIRSGRAQSFDLAGLNLNIRGQHIPGSVVDAAQNELSGAGAAADSELGSRLGVFANGSISVGEVEGDDNQRDADTRSSSITIGVDYRLSDNMVLGAGLGIASNNTEFTQDEGTADLSAFSVTLFGTWYDADKGYLDAVLDVGNNSYEVERRINLPGAADLFASGDTDASVSSFSIGVGNNLQYGVWEVGPYGRFSITSASVDAYSESANTGVAGFGSVLNIGSHTIKSTTLSLGGQLSRTINTRRGVLVPQVRLEAEFENEGNKDGITATFQHDPSETPFTVNGNKRDSQYFNLGLGASAVFANGKSGFLFYETRAQHDFVTQHWLKLGLRFEF